ncbi:hypothetical protein ILUMI_13643 [Ignelater luminosus]|uniref:C2H2-type domain-containing protein n=1 Tax=Ignelater luminosus TaxID=2038154 RepID=A0A8K0GBR5_IGNLU|nr:hypothetical protein ILUMI_13643 [Ignelater luminosus]
MVDSLYSRRETQNALNYKIPRRDCGENGDSNKDPQKGILENAYDSNELTRQSYATPEDGPPRYSQHQSISYPASDYDVVHVGELYQLSQFNPLKRARELPKTSTTVKYGDTFPQNDPNLPKELTMQFQPLYCKLCTAKLSSNVMAKLHYKSKKHEKKVKTFLIDYAKRTGEVLPETVILNKKQKCDEDNNPRYFHCDVCDLPLTGRLHAESHYMGRNHQRALAGKAPSGKGHYSDEGKWVRSPTVTGASSERDNIGLAFDGDAKVETRSNSLYCEICCVNVTSDQQMTVHLNGQKHKKKVQQQANDRINDSPQGNPENNILSTLSSNVPSDDLSVYRTPSGYYYCNPCNLTLNSEIQFNQHLGSKKHRKKANSTNKE